jgi:hypothetical protein
MVQDKGLAVSTTLDLLAASEILSCFELQETADLDPIWACIEKNVLPSFALVQSICPGDLVSSFLLLLCLGLSLSLFLWRGWWVEREKRAPFFELQENGFCSGADWTLGSALVCTVGAVARCRTSSSGWRRPCQRTSIWLDRATIQFRFLRPNSGYTGSFCVFGPALSSPAHGVTSLAME